MTSTAISLKTVLSRECQSRVEGSEAKQGVLRQGRGLCGTLQSVLDDEFVLVSIACRKVRLM